MPVNMIPLDQISVPDNRIRELDADWVELLSADIVERGLIHPIAVRDEGNNSYILISGLHRLEAHKLAGMTDIEAVVRDDDETQARLTEIMENMVRAPLKAFARCQSLFEIDKLYKALHPELKRGGNKQTDEAREKLTAIFAVRSEILEKVGLSERAFRMGIAIYKGLSPATRDLLRVGLRDTFLADHQAQLQLLSQQKAAKQEQVLDILFPSNDSKPEATTVADALELIKNGRLPGVTEKFFTSLIRNISKLDDNGLENVFAAHETKLINWLKSRGSI